MAECRSCHKQVDWAITPSGNRMQVDTDSAGREGGNLGVWREDGQLHCRVLTADKPLQPGEKMGKAHWATCPHASAHRKPRAS